MMDSIAHRKKLRAKRNGISRQLPPLDIRIRSAWDTWRGILLNPEDEIIRCLDRFEHLRALFLEDQAATTFLELGFATFLLDKIRESPSNEILASHLFTISDLVDVDESGHLGGYFLKENLLETVIRLWRHPEPQISSSSSSQSTSGSASTTPDANANPQPALTISTVELSQIVSPNPPEPLPPSGPDAATTAVDRKVPPPPSEPPIQIYRFSSLLGGPSRGISKLKAACLCVISGLAIHDIQKAAMCLEPGDMDVVYSMLLTKGITALHSRCIIFVNNLFVSNIFADRIMERLVPAVMALLMYNVTNHVKLKKHREAQTILAEVQDAQSSAPRGQKKQKGAEGDEPSSSASSAVSTTTTPTVPISETIDPLYDERLYTDFVSSACLFLGNATGSAEVCRMVEAYSIIDIMTLLFHGADHSLDALVSVVKCLANLANIRENRPKLLDSNVLPLAVKLLQLNVQHEDLRAHLTLLVANMAGIAALASPTLAALLSDPALIAAITDLFATTTVDSYERFALLAMANLAVDPAVVPLFVENIVAIKKIIAMCTKSAQPFPSSAWIQRQVTRILHAIASGPSIQLPAFLKSLGAEEALRAVLNSIQSSQQGSSPQPDGTASAEQLAITALAYFQAAPDIPPPQPLHVVDQQQQQQEQAEQSKQAQAAAAPAKQTPTIQQLQRPTPAQTPTPALAPSVPLVPERVVEKPVMRDAPVKQPNPQKAAEEKERGNDFFHKKRFKEAIICYTRAADWSPTDYTLFSNRAAAYMHLEHYELALKDADRCIDMAPQWVKGWFRKGKALIGLEQFEPAINALNRALELEQGNKEIQDALRIANTRMKARASGSSVSHPGVSPAALSALGRVQTK